MSKDLSRLIQQQSNKKKDVRTLEKERMDILRSIGKKIDNTDYDLVHGLNADMVDGYHAKEIMMDVTTIKGDLVYRAGVTSAMNVAQYDLGARAYGSHNYNDPDLAIDEDDATYYLMDSGAGGWIYVDCGEQVSISSFRLYRGKGNALSVLGEYYLQKSDDATTWVQVGSTMFSDAAGSGAATRDETFTLSTPATGRYFRILQYGGGGIGSNWNWKIFTYELWTTEQESSGLSPLHIINDDDDILISDDGLPAWGMAKASKVEVIDTGGHYAGANVETVLAEIATNGVTPAAHTHTESEITDLDHDAAKLQGRALANTAPTDGQAIVWDNAGSTWKPGTVSGSGGSITVKEADGTPSVSSVTTIAVTNGTLTDNGSGQVTLDFGSAATDGAAIHDNVSGEISAITEKTTPVDDDMLIIEDSAASNAKKMIKISSLPTGGTTWEQEFLEQFTAITNWTSRVGTWAVSDGVLSQTATNQENGFLEYTAATFSKLASANVVAMKASIRYPNTGAVWPARVGFCLGHLSGAGIRNGEVTVWLRRNSDATLTIEWDNYGTGGGSFATGVSVAVDTWLTFSVRKIENRYQCFINGTFVGGFVRSDGASTANTCALSMRYAKADYDDVYFWIGDISGYPW